jgi:integrase
MLNDRDRSIARRLLAQFLEFLRERFNIGLEEAAECPHFLDFLEHLVERPRLTQFGKLIQRPIRNGLLGYTRFVMKLLAEVEAPLQLSRVSYNYAYHLQREYKTSQGTAVAAFIQHVRQLSIYLDDNLPRNLRLRAALLTIWQAAARPSEILKRFLPHEVNANHEDGIVITVPQSKTNPGPNPEYFKLVHASDLALCAVCALHKWVLWLGATYNGPLFPNLDERSNVIATPYRTSNLSNALSDAFKEAGITKRRYSAYSLRKGRATDAVIRGVPIESVQTALRHSTIDQTLDYIDRSVLFRNLRNVHD